MSFTLEKLQPIQHMSTNITVFVMEVDIVEWKRTIKDFLKKGYQAKEYNIKLMMEKYKFKPYS